MIAVVVSLVAVVLLVLVVVALGMRSMSRRESSLPPERLKEMAEKEEMTLTRSTDEFSKHEPRMANFSPDFSPIGESKPKPVRTGQRGKRGVDEWGTPSNDDADDEQFWANIRSDAEEGGFGAGGTVAARKASSRPVERERPSERERTAERERPSERERERTAARERPAERQTERPPKRSSRSAKPKPVTASAVDPDATTVQGPLPQRQPSSAANLADLVEPKRATPTQAELADQRTVTFAAPTADVMSILGAGAQPVPAPTRSEQSPATRPTPVASNGVSSNAYPGSGSYASSSANTSGSFPAAPAANASGSFPATTPTSSGSFPAATPTSSGSFPATPTSSGSFPAAPASPIHGAPTSDPFPAYGGGSDPLDTTWNAQSSATTSGSWNAASPDIFDDPAPAAAAPAPYPGANPWPAFEQPAERSSYPSSYEVRSGWAVADDSDPLTGPSPATGTPTVPGRAVSNFDTTLPAPATPQSPFAAGAYETGDITSSPAAAWPEPPSAGNGSQGAWPAHSGQQQPQADNRGSHRRGQEQDFPNDYYR